MVAVASRLRGRLGWLGGWLWVAGCGQWLWLCSGACGSGWRW